jgi:hypothetical protein
METTLQAAEARLKALGFEFIDCGFYECHGSLVLRLGTVADGLLLQPFGDEEQATAPAYLCQTDQEFDQALLLLGAA